MPARRSTCSVWVRGTFDAFVDVEATSEDEAVALVDGCEIADVSQLSDFEAVSAEDVNAA